MLIRHGAWLHSFHVAGEVVRQFVDPGNLTANAKEPRPLYPVGAPSTMYVRRRPTLPHRHQCSTIGAEGLSFRVRNGAGRFPFAMTAVTLGRCSPGHSKLIQ